jgi:hypothetical protein
MELRRHPGMTFHGVSNWPPVWVHYRSDGVKQLKGEKGVLRFVHASNGLSNKCHLVMEHENAHYVGCLIFDDVTFCYALAKKLRVYVGRPINEIGDLDLSDLL